MRLSSFVLGFTLAQIGAAEPASSARKPKSSPIVCPDAPLHVIGVRGASHENPPYGGLTTLITNITSRVPGSDDEPLPYNQSTDNLPLHIDQGADALNQKIMDFTKACPKTKYAIVSYSEGAILMMNSLCGYILNNQTVPGLDGKYAKNMIAATAYGDESYRIDQIYDKSTCEVDGPAPRPFPSCGDFGPLILSYCTAKDNFCCGNGTSHAAHFEYPTEYDIPLAKAVVAKYNAAEKKRCFFGICFPPN